jgi:hypothetical protein
VICLLDGTTYRLVARAKDDDGFRRMLIVLDTIQFTIGLLPAPPTSDVVHSRTHIRRVRCAGVYNKEKGDVAGTHSGKLRPFLQIM